MNIIMSDKTAITISKKENLFFINVILSSC